MSKNLPPTYPAFLENIKQTIQAERSRAIQQLTRSLILVYWEIGKLIVENQEKEGWGKSVVEQLAKDLQEAFPARTGFSARNLWDMRRFYDTYKDFSNLRQLVAEIPWGHHLLIMQKINGIEEKKYYLQAAAEMRWSRKVLLNQIKANAYERHQTLPKQNNFEKALPQHIAEQANEAIKSSYNLEFLGVRKLMLERNLEEALLNYLQDFLLELGYGFSFVGSQYSLALADKTYRVDLLFFHRKLHCLVAIDLKIGEFKPEYAGKMNFHLELLDEQVRLPEENPSIGIILCAEKNNLEVEYALRSIHKPMGVAEYQLMENLPDELMGQLPTAQQLKEQIEKRLKINESDNK